MSDVNDRYVIDQMAIEDEKLVLIIVDPMEWRIVCGKATPMH